MASACVNNIGVTPEKFLNMGWLSPRMSFSREDPKAPKSTAEKIPDLGSSSPAKDGTDFEFRLDDSVIMLPADELFSDGKLVPLHFPKTTQSTSTRKIPPDDDKACRRSGDSLSDPYLLSPKAPRCSSRWRELLGLKKLSQNSINNSNKLSISPALKCSNTGKSSIRQFLHRNSKTTSSSGSDNLHLPLLKDTSSLTLECESLSICSSSRLSLSSSSSSGHDHDDLPRLSLDAAEKPNNNGNGLKSTSRPRIRLVRPRMVPAETAKQPVTDHATAAAGAGRIGRSPMRRAAQQEPVVVARGVSVDSPRMNSSGRVVFQSLERSSSSPSTFNGGPRHKHRGMERSYSANVRVTPVLNVPVCSLRGSSKSGVFRQLFSSSTPQSQKKEGNNTGGNGGSRNHHQHRRKESS